MMKMEPEDKFSYAVLIAVMLFALYTLFSPAPARAATPCDEWANMTKVLVMRWQGDPSFMHVPLKTVKDELEKQMGGHPEIEKAKKYVDFAYKHKDEDPVEVWVKAYNMCNAIPI